MSYPETLEYLFAKLPMYQRQGAAALKFNLNNINALMRVLGDLHKSVKTIHVAGTNGKGSSAHMLSSILQEAGYKTGLYTSPHLKSFTERIRINGKEINEMAVVEFVERIKPVIETISPSFFEITFAMAMEYFRIEAVDIAVIEVGMGGRFDSTNIITPEISLITNISYDHQHFLGDTLEKIATEKAGIIKPNVPVVIGMTQPEIEHVFSDKAKSLSSAIYFADQIYTQEQASVDRLNFIADCTIIYEGVLPDLQGSYQRLNYPGVLVVCDLLKQSGWNLTDTAIVDGIENVTRNTGLKGRWQKLSDRPLIIADTGHNEAGVSEILAKIKDCPYNKLHMVWGMVNDKDVTKILALLPQNAAYYFVKPDIPRGMSSDDLQRKAVAMGLNGQSYASVAEGVLAAKENAEDDDFIFIGGSTFVVAEIEEL